MNETIKKYYDGAKIKAQKVAIKGLEMIRDGATWVQEHPQETGTILMTAGVVGRVIIKTFKPTAAEVEEKRLASRYYDPRSGIRYPLKRPLTGRQAAELERRRNDGELVGDILADMRVSKR